MKCPICNEETAGRDTKMWGCEFAHVTCIKAYSLGASDSAVFAPEPAGEVRWAADVEGSVKEVRWKNGTPTVGTLIYTTPKPDEAKQDAVDAQTDYTIKAGDVVKHPMWTLTPLHVVDVNWALGAAALQLGPKGGTVVWSVKGLTKEQP